MKTRPIRIVSLLLAAVLLLLPLSGCGKKAATLDDLKPTDELVIYLPQELERHVTSDYIAAYRDLYGADVRVKLVVVPGDDYTLAGYAERVVNELLGGEGPDILFLDWLPNLDVEKAARNHNFYDLTDLLASDPDFHEEDYADHIFESAKIGGRLYAMPLTYLAPVFLSNQAKLEELGFSWDGIGTTSDFMEELARLTPAAEQAGFEQLLESKNRFRELFRCSGIRLLDYDNQTVLPDEAALYDFLQGYKTFFPYDYDASAGIVNGNYRADALAQGSMAFWCPPQFQDLGWNLNDMTAAACSPVFGTLPGEEEEVVGQIAMQLAVNAASKNVRNAYNFIKLMISEEMQGVRSTDTLVYEVPINKKAAENDVYGRTNYYGYQGCVFLSNEEKDALVRRYTDMDRFTWKTANKAYDMLWEAMLPYLQDEKSYEDCVSELKSKLNFYLSE